MQKLRSGNVSRVRTIVRVVLVAGVIALVAASVAHLFALRFEQGDVYPPYSTLRADPLGARAYYEALGRLPGLEVERNLRPLPRLGLDAPGTLFVLGLERWIFDSADEASVREMEHLASLGGRIVITFAPSYDPNAGGGPFVRSFAGPVTTPTPTPISPFAPPLQEDGDTTTTATTATATKAYDATTTTALAGEDEEDIPSFMGGRAVALGDRWGVRLKHSAFPVGSGGDAGYVEARRAEAAPEDLPEMLYWHSAITFEPQDARWRTIYARGETPVAIEREWGRGTIMMMADSYYFSNEAARHDRQPALLAWAAGPHEWLIFNETHHGVLVEPGIMGLAREYHLEGVLISLLALALLFVWRNASSLVPRGAGGGEAAVGEEAKRAAATSLAQLLRRHIPPAELLAACFTEWRQSPGMEKKRLRDNIALMESIVYYEGDKPSRERDLAAAYREMTRILHERRVRRDPDPR